MLKYILFLVLVPCVALGQAITGVTGDVTNGENIVITGSNFGSKTTVAPAKLDWTDDAGYSSLSHGDVIPGGASLPWDGQYPTDSVRYCSDSSTRVSGRAMYETSKKGFLEDSSTFASYSSQRAYISWWFKANHRLYSIDGNAVFNKFVRYTGSSWEDQIEVEPHRIYGSVTDCAAAGWDWWGGSYSEPVPDVWLNIEVIFDAGADIANGTGEAWVYFNGVEKGHHTSVYSCSGSLMRFHRWGSDPHTSIPYPENSEIFFGELYADDSWARVVIGNASTYASCTHREIQIPSAWSATEITATVNTGSFSDNDDAYLFVVDADGDVSAGYAVTIGEGAASGLNGCGTITATRP